MPTSSETMELSKAPTPPKTRAQALRSYDVADFPTLTGREEEWRFTPLKRLRGLADGSITGTGTAPNWGFADLPSGVTAFHAGAEDPRIGSALVPFDRISALAFGSSAGAFVIEVAKDTVVERPAVFQLNGAGIEGATFGHTVIAVGALSESTLVLRQTGSTILADNVEVLVGDSSTLTLITVADWDADAVQAQHVKFRLGRDAKVTHIQVTLGGDLVRQYTSAEYTGRGGDFEAFGLYFATDAAATEGAGQHQEHRLLVDHSVPDCRSHVTYRGALQGDGAHAVWVGDVLIRAEATGTDTYEINRNLLLTDGARADSVPNLEIETGEVSGAGHASTTGRFDDEHLFYLMSRGIPEVEARKLVVRGFFAELLVKIPLEDLRDYLTDVIDSRLAAVGE